MGVCFSGGVFVCVVFVECELINCEMFDVVMMIDICRMLIEFRMMGWFIGLVLIIVLVVLGFFDSVVCVV